MRRKDLLLTILALLATSAAQAQSAFTEEEFTEDDFAQFFSLIENGKISKEKMSTRCAEQHIGFTFAGADLSHEGAPQRIFYNVSRENTSIDGRTLRAKHANASFGEWTGAVFKPLCPGLYALSIDFSTADTNPDAAEEVYVHLFLRRPDEQRPGQKIISARKSGPGGSGHTTLALTLNSGDEISTWSESKGDTPRTLEHITFTAYKVAHLENLVKEIDMDAWTSDIMKLKREN
jgi:hypothetical protein